MEHSSDAIKNMATSVAFNREVNNNIINIFSTIILFNLFIYLG